VIPRDIPIGTESSNKEKKTIIITKPIFDPNAVYCLPSFFCEYQTTSYEGHNKA
jgi:hypothetical protein